MSTTVHWRPNESSLSRSSFNAIVSKRSADVPEILMRDSSMGQKAMMGPGWEPAGIMSRNIANMLMTKKSTLQASSLGRSQSLPALRSQPPSSRGS